MYHFDGGADGGRGCVWEGARGAHGKSLCLPRNFALNLKLLLKIFFKQYKHEMTSS